MNRRAFIRLLASVPFIGLIPRLARSAPVAQKPEMIFETFLGFKFVRTQLLPLRRIQTIKENLKLGVSFENGVGHYGWILSHEITLNTGFVCEPCSRFDVNHSPSLREICYARRRHERQAIRWSYEYKWEGDLNMPGNPGHWLPLT